MRPAGPTTPSSKLDGLGYVRVRSPLLAESLLFSVPPGTEMVHFPGLPSHAYGFSEGYRSITRGGFPHSEIAGSKPVCGSPTLIAAYHVLHRLLAPRHSPYALSSLTYTSGFDMSPCVTGISHCVCCNRKLPSCRIFSCQRAGAAKRRRTATCRPTSRGVRPDAFLPPLRRGRSRMKPAKPGGEYRARRSGGRKASGRTPREVGRQVAVRRRFAAPAL